MNITPFRWLMIATLLIDGLFSTLSADTLDIQGMVPRNPKPPPAHIIEVARENNRWIAGADGGIISHSEDGINWSTVAVDYPKGIQAIIYWNGTYYAGGVDGGWLLRSIDLVNWVETRPANYPTNPHKFLIHGDRLYLAAWGGASGLSYTEDGETWTSVIVPESSRFDGLATNGSRFVLVGSQGFIHTSEDGENWTVLKNGLPGLSGLDDDFMFVTWVNGQFVAGGKQGLLMTSPDGLDWTLVETPFDDWLYDVVFFEGNYYLPGRQGTVLCTADLSEWTELSTGLTTDLQDIASDETGILVGGRNGFVAYSEDGIEWEITTDGTREYLREVEYGADVFVATDANGGIWLSNDSEGWVPVHTVSDSKFVAGLVYDGSQFVGISSNGGLLTSLDGDTWIESTGFEGDPERLRYLEGAFWAVGDDGLIASSSNLSEWDVHNMGTDTFLDIAFGNGRYVACGRNGLLYSSPDGADWTMIDTGLSDSLKSVGYLNGRFIVLGRPNILLVSTDGISWESMGTNLTPFDNNRLEIFDGQFVGTGYLGRINTSEDGLEWSTIYSRTSQGLLDIVFGGGRTVGVGVFGTILSSKVVLSGGYQEWKEVRFNPTQQLDINTSGPDADPDKDGRTNAFEFFSNTPPLVKDAGPPFAFDLLIDGGNLIFEFEIRRRKELAGVALEFWGSSDISSWNQLTEEQVVENPPSPLDEETDLLRYRITRPVDQPGLRLMTLGIGFDG